MSGSTQFDQDEDGRTALFRAAESGDIQAVEEIIYSLTGTGMCCQRLTLISHKDREGLTAIDAAQRAGHEEIAGLLGGEKGRMEFFE